MSEGTISPKKTAIRFGTCSWNYNSWVGMVYAASKRTAADYLTEYAAHFRTVEIDSWFYRIPASAEVNGYKKAVDGDFRFTCKVPQEITLTHLRQKGKEGALIANESFLSPELFKKFLAAIEPLLPQIDAIMFEFEYLNKQKMASQEVFHQKISDFFAQLPSGLPYAIETRNGNYLNQDFFRLLIDQKLIPVFSEKIYMPHIYEIYAQVGHLIGSNTVVRLLGGDRKEMEEKSGEHWNSIIEEKSDKKQIVSMMQDLTKKGFVTCNVNNHYEGAAPLTIKELMKIEACCTP